MKSNRYAFIGACGDCHVMWNYKWKPMLASFFFKKRTLGLDFEIKIFLEGSSRTGSSSGF
jgi:hypothetical protein